ncbi:WD repeat protein [Grosmannia clavigera kw1407]|uniref:Probable cytosolic iron-sulfur protein assembly protein 1 n=1 Tax=Grosmannia clavigera (strain kw1407 / UAMH 11150) TaxID=655863 RepID=F0XIU7_GROCL|nr:WD repeat protein [Grosmannia clavigera kw1407]EFX02103.1 WD repeat protein [Grosmannia clavigera kw1407]
MASAVPYSGKALAASLPLLPRAIEPLPPFQPDLYQRGWSSTPHPTLPFLATAHNKSVTIFSLVDFTSHSSLTGGHSRSVRSVTWRPDLPSHKLCLVSGSFDSTAGLWRWEQETPLVGSGSGPDGGVSEVEIRAGEKSDGETDEGWEFTLVLEGQEHEIKSVAFSPSGQYLATCSRDKSVWIWEDVGGDDEDEWETVAVLNEHDGDVKCVAWCPDVPGRRSGSGSHYGLDVLASTSYDNTVRIWREDGDGEWVCVAVLEGHEGTVWGVQWEADPRRERFPRLLTWSADQTLRIWTLREDDVADAGATGSSEGSHGIHQFHNSLGGVPNTMRCSLHEEWSCTAVLPRAHSRDIYSAAWSGATGLVASTGSDGVVVLYAEQDRTDGSDKPVVTEDEAAEELDGDIPMPRGHGHNATSGTAKQWRVLASVTNAHGPYEINNITWCRRYDAGAKLGGLEEMLVTTGDDGVVRPWQIVT